MLTSKGCEQTQHMFHIAKSDYQYAQFGMEHLDKETRSCENQICYVFQQSGEKLLKAFLWSSGKKPAKTHNMSDLFGACLDVDPTLELIQDSCMVLQGFVAFARYPESEEHFCDQEDVFDAHQAANQILQIISPLIEKNLFSAPCPEE